MRDVRVIVPIGAAHLTSHFLQLTLPPLFPHIRTAFDVPYAALGLVLSVFYAASGIGQAVSGFLVDRLGARRVLLAGMALFAGAVAALGLAPTYAVLLPIALAAGAGNSVFHPADYAILTASVSPGRLARAYGVHGILGNAGWILGPLLVVSVTGLAGWRAALLTAGGLSLAATGALALATRPLAAHRELRGQPAGQPLAADLRLLLSPPILAAFAYFMLLSTAFVGIQTFSVAAMAALYATPLPLATGALTAFFFGNAAGILAGGVLADRVGRHDLVVATGLLLAAALTALVGSGRLPLLLLTLAMGLVGFWLGLTSPSRDMLVRAVTPRGASGKVFGFVYSGLDLGSLLAPPVYGWLLDRHEPRAMFALAAALMLLTIATVAALRRQARPAPLGVAAD